MKQFRMPLGLVFATLLSVTAYAADIPVDELGAQKMDKLQCVDQYSQNCIDGKCSNSEETDCQESCKRLAQEKCQEENN